ncbi:MAG: hypothetical protein ACKOPF_06130 [Candidatus Limnocylindrus sp.]
MSKKRELSHRFESSDRAEVGVTHLAGFLQHAQRVRQHVEMKGW